MPRNMLFIIVGLFCLSPSLLFADGRYRIGEDKKGAYMETELDGSWYIDPDDVKDFRIGEEGIYSTGADTQGHYIVVGKDRKFYIDKKTWDQHQKRLEEFNKNQAQTREMESGVLVEGSQILVPVVLDYEGNEAEVLLLLDTGASMLVIHREVADQLKIKGVQKTKLLLVGGESLDADVVKLDSVKTGPVEKKNVVASIIDYKGPAIRHQGLLGMNFLEDFVCRIDLQRRMIVWEK